MKSVFSSNFVKSAHGICHSYMIIMRSYYESTRQSDSNCTNANYSGAGGNLIYIFCDKTINVQAQLMLHIVRWCKFERWYCMNDETKGREKQMSDYLILIPSSATFLFFVIQSTSKLFPSTFNFTEGRGYQTLNSIFHSWANHVLFQQ